MADNKINNGNLQQAVSVVLSRASRDTHPEGKFDGKKRWTPSDSEYQSCCDSIRTPSAAYPFSMMVHCRSIEHVAHLHDVEVKRLRKAVRAAKTTSSI